MEVNPISAFTSRFVEIGEHRMHYLDEGDGPAVVLLHGNPTWCYLYRHLITNLSKNYRVIAPDQIGCGMSSRVSDFIRFKERVSQFGQFIEQLGLGKFSLVMHDWGGPIGTAMALDRQSQVERLVYFNTTLTEVDSLPRLIKMAAAPVIGPFLTYWTDRFIRYTTELGVGGKLSEKDKQGYFWPYKSVKSRKAIHDFVKDIPFSSSHPSYHELESLRGGINSLASLPVQIIWGLKDPCFHKGVMESVASHYPNAEVHAFEDASHLVIEDKRSEVLGLLRRFLSTGTPSQSS